VWWHTAIITALKRPRQGGGKFKASLGYKALFKKKKKSRINQEKK
jgi:hypothetical protein